MPDKKDKTEISEATKQMQEAMREHLRKKETDEEYRKRSEEQKERFRKAMFMGDNLETLEED